MKFRSLRILQLLKVLFTGLSFQTNTTYAFASDKEILQKHKKKKQKAVCSLRKTPMTSKFKCLKQFLLTCLKKSRLIHVKTHLTFLLPTHFDITITNLSFSGRIETFHLLRLGPVDTFNSQFIFNLNAAP